jgi:hypothetical protein
VALTADPVARATEVFALLERGDAARIRAVLSDQVRRWPVEEYLKDFWAPAIEELAGTPRRILDGVPLSEAAARLTVEGPRGRGLVSVRFDDADRLRGLALHRRIVDGIGTVVIACPAERRAEMAAFYSSLVGADRWRTPVFAFGESRSGFVPPRWPDPAHPQHLHLDLFTADLDATEQVALAHGATRLLDTDDHRTYADPAGHPFCLYPESTVDGPNAVIGRIVFDCFSPRSLAGFWAAVLDMPRRVEDTPERVVIASDDGGTASPMLAFQHVPAYVPPVWPGSTRPQQMHLDLKFDDSARVQRVAEERGAIRLPPHGGSCPVYADPAGHPFCLCLHAE